MESIFKDDKKRKISKIEDISFTTKTSGLYLIETSAVVKSEKQLGGSDDEDLRIEIDKRKFPQLNNSVRYFDSPASFSGGTSKGLKKTIYFILPLNVGKHTVSLIPDISATLIKIEAFKVSEDPHLNELDLSINEQAEDGDRRSWIVFVLIDLALNNLTTEFNLKRRFIDSDDVKVIIDDSIIRNNRSTLHKLWYFAASLLTGENQVETFTVNLSRDLHYMEFWADRMPTFKKITFYDLKADNIKELSPEEVIKEKIRSEADKTGLDPQLMLSIATWESHFDPKAISPVGAKGIFQLMDITIRYIKERFGFEIEDPFDAEQNITGAMLYFKWLFDRYEGDAEQVEKALAAWNWGLNNFPKDSPLDWNEVPDQTKAFIKNVLNR